MADAHGSHTTMCNMCNFSTPPEGPGAGMVVGRCRGAWACEGAFAAQDFFAFQAAPARVGLSAAG